MFLFAPFLKIRPLQFLAVAIFILLMIPLSFMLIVLVPFLIQTLNGTPGDVLWTTLVGNHISSLIAPLVKGTIFETGIPLNFQKLYFAPLVAAIAASYAFLSFVSDYMLRDYAERIAKHLRTKIAKKLLSISYAATTHVDNGFLSSMVGTDVQETHQTFVRITTSILRDCLMSIVFVGWLILLDFQLFILFITIIIPAALILAKTGRVLKKLSKQGIQLESDLLSALLERMRGWQTIQIYKAISFEIARFRDLNVKIFNTWRRATRAKALGSPLVEWFAIVAGGLIAVIALRRVYSGEITTPILVSFVITVGLLGDKINRISDQMNSSKRGIESLRRILAFFKSDFEKREIIDFSQKHEKNDELSNVKISNLSVANLDKTLLIEKLSGVYHPGSFVVLIGPSGIGKTTFLNVLLGILKAPSGGIFLNEQSATEKIYLKYASQIGFIPQEPHIFYGSVLDNLTYPQKLYRPSEQDIKKAQQSLEFANLDIKLNQEVFGLSGGEKQRLMFARIFFNEPRLIVIDEGTSALDTFNENFILQKLGAVLNCSIIFMVSHRASVKKFATDIIDLSKYQNLA